jgi:predicted site-specific integrase-resolvase
MDRLVSISEAVHILGVSVTTLRRWERDGKWVSKGLKWLLNDILAGKMGRLEEATEC